VRFVLLMTVPLALPCCFLFLPVKDVTGVWTDDCSIVALYYLSSLVNWNPFPILFVTFTGVELGWKSYMRMAAWTTATSTIVITIVFSAIISLDVFPLPLMNLVMATLGSPMFAALWYVVPSAQRSDDSFLPRAKWCLLLCILLVCFFGIGFPILNSYLIRVGLRWQMLLLALFQFTKLSFEGITARAAKTLDRDSLPTVVYIAAHAYELNLCIALSGPDANWPILAQLVAFDAVENGYHLVSFLKRADEDFSKTSVVLVQLLVREFIEVAVPTMYLSMITFARHTNPRSNDLICDLNDEQFYRTRGYLLIDVGIELIVVAITYVLLVRKGLSPLKLVIRLIDTHFFVYISLSSLGWSYYFTMLHSHGGGDLTFSFPWLRDDTSWHCGHKWDQH